MQIIGELNLLSFSCKSYHFLSKFYLTIFMGNPSLRLSGVLKRIVGNPNFSSDQFKKIIKHYKRVGYNLDVMRQSACLVVNPINVYSYVVSSLIARRWVRPQTQLRLWCQALISGLEPDACFLQR